MKLKFLYAIMAVGFLFTSCGDDDGGADLTALILGIYTGDYVEGIVTINDVETEVTKVSSDEIEIDIKVFPGLATVTFNADMTDETNFTVPEFTLNDSDLSGSGSLLNGTTLKIDLIYVDGSGDDISYEGTK